MEAEELDSRPFSCALIGITYRWVQRSNDAPRALDRTCVKSVTKVESAEVRCLLVPQGDHQILLSL